MADIETEREMSRTEVAAYLHEFADKLGGTRSDQTNRGGVTENEGGTSSDDETNRSGFEDDVDRQETTQSDTEGKRVTFTLGNDSATVNPPETIEFEVAVDSTAGMLESSSHETVKFTLRWDAEATDDDGELGLH